MKSISNGVNQNPVMEKRKCKMSRLGADWAFASLRFQYFRAFLLLLNVQEPQQTH
jgi:hypothetical protein